MATHHASPGEVVDLATWDHDLPARHSKVITKTPGLELARLVLEAGEHMQNGGSCRVPGPIVIHCLEGEVDVTLTDRCERLRPGQLLYLEGGDKHSLAGIHQSVVLLTIVLNQENSGERQQTK